MSINYTNTIIALCPYCDNNIPLLTLTELDIIICCHCSGFSTISLKDYLSKLTSNRKCTYINRCEEHNEIFNKYDISSHEYFCPKCIIDNQYYSSIQEIADESIVTRVKENLSKAKIYLNSYFLSLKNKIELKEENKQSIENAYNECIEENNLLLKFYEIILDNYHYDNFNMSNNLSQALNLNFNKPFDEKDNESIIAYFNSFRFNQMKYVKCIKEENLHPYSIENIILVKLFDGRIATCNDEKKVIVYDPLNDYHCDVVIEDADLYPSSLCQL